MKKDSSNTMLKAILVIAFLVVAFFIVKWLIFTVVVGIVKWALIIGLSLFVLGGAKKLFASGKDDKT